MTSLKLIGGSSIDGTVSQYPDLWVKGGTRLKGKLTVNGDVNFKNNLIIDGTVSSANDIVISSSGNICLSPNDFIQFKAPILGDTVIAGSLNVFDMDLNCGNIANVNALYVSNIFGKSPITFNDHSIFIGNVSMQSNVSVFNTLTVDKINVTSIVRRDSCYIIPTSTRGGLSGLSTSFRLTFPTTVFDNFGPNDITYARDATNGDTWTIGKNGNYAVVLVVSFNLNQIIEFGIFVNDTASTAASAESTTNRLAGTTDNTQDGHRSTISWTGYLSAGSVLSMKINNQASLQVAATSNESEVRITGLF